MDLPHVIIGILGIALLMIVHEGGHFLAARACGMRVLKFSIGFGPTLFKVQPDAGYYWFTMAGSKVKIRLFKHDPERHGPTIYQVGIVPFLAYVQVHGMNPFEEVDPKDKSSYANAKLWARIAVIFAGPFANYLFAILVLFGVYALAGPLDNPSKVTALDGRPAKAAGVRDGDLVVQVAGVDVSGWNLMADTISESPGRPIQVVVEREGQRMTFEVTPENIDGKGRIGVGLHATATPFRKPVTVKEAASRALMEPILMLPRMWQFVRDSAKNRSIDGVGGPAAMVEQTARAAKLGLAWLLEFLAIISASLAAFNLIPFPALDGGRLIFLGYEATTRRRPNPRVEAAIHGVGLVMLLSFMTYVTVFKDFGLGSK